MAEHVISIRVCDVATLNTGCTPQKSYGIHGIPRIGLSLVQEAGS